MGTSGSHKQAPLPTAPGSVPEVRLAHLNADNVLDIMVETMGTIAGSNYVDIWLTQ